MSCFGTPFANERVNGFQTLLKSARHHYYPLFSSIRGKLSFKKSPSVWYEILRLFVNALTADDKYCDSNMQNFSQQCQTPLSQKQNCWKPHHYYHLFSSFRGNVSWKRSASVWYEILRLYLDFLLHSWSVHQKKDDYPSLIFSEIIDAERRSYLNV